MKNGLKDDELDLEGRDKPKFGQHGNRRRADKTATDTKNVTGATDGDIDDHFGWDQKKRRQTSRIHYKGRSERIKRARVTMML